MKVAFCIRPDWETTHGGDSVQLVKTVEALQSHHGVQATIVTDPGDAAIRDAEVVHVFNIQTEEISSAFGRAAIKAGRPYVVSTIYWDLRHARFVDMMGTRVPSPAWKALKGAFDVLSRIAGATLGRPRYAQPSRRRLVRELLTGAAALLPNSQEEAQMVARDFGFDHAVFQPVVNAIDTSLFTPPVADGARDGACIVGRVQPIKNQLGVVAALADLPVRLTIVGAEHDASYVAKVRAVASPQVEFISRLAPADVAALLQRSSVHLLPSFRESPGLSTLEALACGCRVVVSSAEFCPVQTYFGDLVNTSVFVCDPYDPDSIRRSTESALASTAQPDMTAWRSRFTWEQAAEDTMAGYQRALDS